MPSLPVPGPRGALPAPILLNAAMIIAAAGALALALRAPLALTVLGLIAFGVLHNVLELRYVAGRFAAVLTGRFLILLVILISGIVACRLIAGYQPAIAKYAEVGLGYLVLGVGCWYGLRGRRLVVALLVLAVAAVGSFGWPSYHFVMLTHLHNLVPLVFLWEWARRIPGPARGWFRASQVLWVLVVPALILAGAVDPLIVADPGVVAGFVGDGTRVIAASAPPDASVTIGLRLLVIFAFLQTMHYVVWVGFLPRFAPEAAAAFDARVPWLRGWRTWAVGAAGGVFLAALFLSDYFAGKALYGALASYHAYLEFPVLLALLMTPVPQTRTNLS
ncbi:hypothetical protein [Microlunatus sp. GCM10028923]|uniref:hypothetical protein n=1 Tax=Microlunatus sp. GCM10028923 TaxID=3273400 RepID=UPI0036147E59